MKSEYKGLLTAAIAAADELAAIADEMAAKAEGNAEGINVARAIRRLADRVINVALWASGVQLIVSDELD